MPPVTKRTTARSTPLPASDFVLVAPGALCGEVYSISRTRAASPAEVLLFQRGGSVVAYKFVIPTHGHFDPAPIDGTRRAVQLHREVIEVPFRVLRRQSGTERMVHFF